MEVEEVVNIATMEVKVVEEVMIKQTEEEEIVSAKQDSEVVVHSNLHAKKEEEMVTIEENMATVEENMATEEEFINYPEHVKSHLEVVQATPLPARPTSSPTAQEGMEVISSNDNVEKAKQDLEKVVYSKIQKEEEQKGNESKVSFSMEDLDYDDVTGQLFIHLESGMAEVTDLQSRDQLLAKMSSVPNDDNLLASIFPSPEDRITPTLSQVPDVGEALSGTPPVPLKPINFRLQEQRLTCGHLGQSRAQSLGRWTSWTRDLLISDLEAAFTRPRRGIFWSDFSPEEKLARFDMVDWGATYPLDPPPRSLMFEPAEDYWSTWA